MYSAQQRIRLHRVVGKIGTGTHRREFGNVWTPSQYWLLRKVINSMPLVYLVSVTCAGSLMLLEANAVASGAFFGSRNESVVN